MVHGYTLEEPSAVQRKMRSLTILGNWLWIATAAFLASFPRVVLGMGNSQRLLVAFVSGWSHCKKIRSKALLLCKIRGLLTYFHCQIAALGIYKQRKTYRVVIWTYWLLLLKKYLTLSTLTRLGKSPSE